jgi:hypothetical protein
LQGLTIQQFPGFLQEFNAMAYDTAVANGQLGGRFIPRSVVEKNTTELIAAYRYITERGAVLAGIAVNVSREVVGDVWNSVNPKWRDILVSNVIQTYVPSVFSFGISVSKNTPSMTF